MSEAARRDRPDEIQREIEGTRSEMAETLTTIERRLSPDELIDQAVRLARAHGPAFGRRLGEAISRNPVPAVLAGVGLVWLVLAASRPAPPRGRAAGPARGYPMSFPGDAPMATVRDNLTDWLRDAYAMENQAIEILEKQASRLEHYPELEAKVRQHLEESRRQAERVEQALERLGADTSAFKTGLGKITGTVQQLTGLFASDEVMKSAIADYAFEHYEIACYRILIATAEEAGEPEVGRLLEQNLREEEAMADWLGQRLGDVTRQYLRREASGQEAKR